MNSLELITAIALLAEALGFWGCVREPGSARPAELRQNAQLRPLRVAIDSPPLTLNPRASLDATSQRIGSLLFRGLTRIDTGLAPRGDLAESWRVLSGGTRWEFAIRPGLKDHEGGAVDAGQIARCLEQYRAGRPVSALKGAFPSWKETRAVGSSVVIELLKPDPYLASNLSLLRYFRSKGITEPCADPGQNPVIGTGDYRMLSWQAAPESEIPLVRVDPRATDLQPGIEFIVVRDDGTRLFRLMRGEIDLVQNGLSFTKTRWLESHHKDRFEVIELPGVNVSYLAFNHRDPLLSRREVRRAIALAIDRDAVVMHKMMGFAEVAGSFLSPSLPESHSVDFRADPVLAERILDGLGLKRSAEGVRFHLKYRTTPSREGSEQALIFKEMLRKIGVVLDVEVVETAVFLPSLQKGGFQLYSSRWIGASDGSIFYRAMRTGQSRNRSGYSDAEMDRLLDQSIAEVDLDRRKALLARVQARMMEDMAYFPLWFWKNALIVPKGTEAPALSLSGSFDPLARIRLVR